MQPPAIFLLAPSAPHRRADGWKGCGAEKSEKTTTTRIIAMVGIKATADL